MTNRDQQWYEDEYWNWMPTDFNYSDYWMAKSEKYIKDASISRNLSYGGKSDENFDLFVPEGSAKQKAPVLIFIHGGYWQWLDKDHYSFSLEPIRSAGAIVVNVNYTLCPENDISGIVEQVRRACAYVYRNIENHHGDRDNIHVTGHSAGGQLTGMIAATDWRDFGADLPIDLVKSAIPSSGIFNMENIRRTPQLQDGLKLAEDSARENSPIFLNPSHDMPVSVVVGANESQGFILESRAFAKAWAPKLTNIRYIEIPGVHHFSLIDNMVNSDDPFTKVILEHLELWAP